MHLIGYGTKKQIIHNLIIWGCHIEAKIDSHVPNLNSRTEDRYYMGATSTKGVNIGNIKIETQLNIMSL